MEELEKWKKYLKNGIKSMAYEIELSEDFLEESEEIYEYIHRNLKADMALQRLKGKIKKYILGLKDSPKIFANINRKNRLKYDYRRMVVDNYIILYFIIEKERVVIVSHIYYSGRNYINGGLL